MVLLGMMESGLVAGFKEYHSVTDVDFHVKLTPEGIQAVRRLVAPLCRAVDRVSHPPSDGQRARWMWQPPCGGHAARHRLQEATAILCSSLSCRDTLLYVLSLGHYPMHPSTRLQVIDREPEELFKLRRTGSLNNMHLFDAQGVIKVPAACCPAACCLLSRTGSRPVATAAGGVRGGIALGAPPPRPIPSCAVRSALLGPYGRC
jgi:hypothetical protein